MTAKTFFGIRERLLFLLLVVLAVSYTAGAWYTGYFQTQTQAAAERKRLDNITGTVADALSAAGNGDTRKVSALLDAWVAAGRFSYGALTDENGMVLAQAGQILQNTKAKTVNHAVDLEPGRGMVLLQFPRYIAPSPFAYLQANLWSGAISLLTISVLAFVVLTRYLVKPLAEIRRSIMENEDVVLDDYSEVHDDFELILQQFRSFHRLRERNREKWSEQNKQLQAQLEHSHQQLQDRERNLEKTKQELQRLVYLDPLTGLFNRHHFEELLGEHIKDALQRGQRYTLLLIELDQLKSINDNHDSTAGNYVIKQIAARLSSAKAGCDTLCRIGGKTFAMLCANVDQDKAAVLASYLRNKVSASSVQWEHTRFDITISVGSASIPGSAGIASGDELHKAAAVALQSSRGKGGNHTVHFDQIMDRMKNPEPAWLPNMDHQVSITG